MWVRILYTNSPRILFTNEQHNPRNSVHFEHHGIRDRNDREIRRSCHRTRNCAGRVYMDWRTGYLQQSPCNPGER